MIDYLLDLISKTVKKSIVDNSKSKYTIDIPDAVTTAWEFYEVIKTSESRAAKIQYGCDIWQEYKKQIGFVLEDR